MTDFWLNTALERANTYLDSLPDPKRRAILETRDGPDRKDPLMAKITGNAQFETTATFIFNEGELRALDALAGYGTDAFLQTFYEKMGKVYLQPHEQHLRSLFEEIRATIPAILARADKAREVFANG